MTQDWYSDDKATMGDRLLAARERAGLSEAELARRLGVRAKTLTAWEADEVEPRSNHLRTLSGLLGVSLIWLLTGEGAGEGDGVQGDAPTPGREAVLTEIRALQQAMGDATRRLQRLERLMIDG